MSEQPESKPSRTKLEIIVDLLKSDSTFVKVISWITLASGSVGVFALAKYLGVGAQLWNFFQMLYNLAIELKDFIF